MRYASVVFAAAVSCLAGVFAIAPAKADVFDFSFGPGASGTFTTGAASPTDPGYELVTGLTFDVLSGKTDSGVSFSFKDQVGEFFVPGAAFNPTTEAFIHHGVLGEVFDDIGDFVIPSGLIDGPSFSERSLALSGLINSGGAIGDFTIPESLLIVKGTAPVPEPSTWVMMLLGFACLGWLAQTRGRKTSLA
jgi:PEP-CTERM motif